MSCADHLRYLLHDGPNPRPDRMIPNIPEELLRQYKRSRQVCIDCVQQHVSAFTRLDYLRLMAAARKRGWRCTTHDGGEEEVTGGWS